MEVRRAGARVSRLREVRRLRKGLQLTRRLPARNQIEIAGGNVCSGTRSKRTGHVKARRDDEHDHGGQLKKPTARHREVIPDLRFEILDCGDPG